MKAQGAKKPGKRRARRRRKPRTNAPAARAAAQIRLELPESLPIAAAADEIAQALGEHQVIIVAGETGSGKTTQLPKICMQAGLGIQGMIGHTQPRRIAARSVAKRIATEIGARVGDAVGLKLRFTDETGPATRLKLMTDGTLLNEIRTDRRLSAYEALIIDEAHERSLNIDFLLGYLKRILPRRPDLKIVVTSATIDPDRFAAHLGDAPVIRVPGRTFPVEMLYRPRKPRQLLGDSVVAAAKELVEATDAARGAGPEAGGDAEKPGPAPVRDILVFLPGERWIREAEQTLRRFGPPGFDIVPLYARLSDAQQDAVFSPGEKPRIVLATNVAETSLTVPRIGYVIDSGLARISRYAARHRFQGLRVEPISQASAAQRAGRCGRIGPGRCVRLYSEDDFAARPEFTEPEILRTNLAGVILQLKALGFGSIEKFPFPDQPPTTMVNDALRLLRLLGALDTRGRLTKLGRRMARMPLEPRVARLLCSARENGSLREGLVIAAALSVADPREPGGAESEADKADESGCADPDSDFLVYLRMWRELRRQRRRGQRAVRGWCRQQRLSYSRVLEWEDVHAQLLDLTRSFRWRTRSGEATYRQIHEAVLAAFVDFLGERVAKGRYRGINDAGALIFPGSGLASRSPRWIVAAERIAMEQSYFRTVAKINPRWLLSVCPHLIVKQHIDPAWNTRRQRVEATEVLKLMGFEVGRRRRVDYGPIDPGAARQIFIREALAKDALSSAPDVLRENRAACATVLDWESRLRRRDLFIGEPGLARFYESRLSPDVRDAPSLAAYCSDAAAADKLRLGIADVATRQPSPEELEGHPLSLSMAGQSLQLQYVYDPTSEQDGVTLELPESMLEAVGPEIVDWIVPAWLPEKVTQLLRLLPKQLRRRLVPIPDTTQALLPVLLPYRGVERLSTALKRVLAQVYDLDVDEQAFDQAAIPKHLNMCVSVAGSGGDFAHADRDYAGGRIRLLNDLSEDRSLSFPGAEAWTWRNISLADFVDLPDTVSLSDDGHEWLLYPGLSYAEGQIHLGLFPPSRPARIRHGEGVRQLLLKSLPQQTAMVRKRLGRDQELLLLYFGVGTEQDLTDDLLGAAAASVFPGAEDVRTRAALDRLLDAGRAGFIDTSLALEDELKEILIRHRDIQQQRARKPSRVPRDARMDMQEQLNRLVNKTSLRATPAEWRRHIPRYLEAIAIRWQKLEQAHPKDAQYQQAVAVAWRRLADWQATRPRDWPLSRSAEEYRWLIEEYRVSLFAQALGTAFPVSAKRLDAAWREVELGSAQDLEYSL